MKTFLSIGTGPGIGIATAERFSKAGFRTLLCSRDPARLEAHATGLRALGQACETMRVDAADATDVQALISKVLELHGSIDVLHYNAASLRQSTLEEQPAATFAADLCVNIAGAMVAIQAVSTSMFARSEGTLLLTGGRFGLAPVPEYIALSVGKAGIRALALGLFESFKSKGVHVAIVNVAATVEPASELSLDVADEFWKVYNAPRDEWICEVTYPGI